MKCRFCQATCSSVFIDLLSSPAANSFLSKADLSKSETYYPLKVLVCDSCYLVQIAEHKGHAEIFDSGYVYFSSFSKSWLQHAKDYSEMVISRFGLNCKSLVVEIASNDGYLLRNFVERKIPCFGVEPTHNTAEAARELGIETISEFFGNDLAQKLAEEKGKADLLIGNNVLAHVPDINDFVSGLSTVLASDGVVTMEFPHLYQLVKCNQFDTVYQEHFSYLSFNVVRNIFAKHGLTIFDIDQLPTHGGSIRIYAKHTECKEHKILASVSDMLQLEEQAGMLSRSYYTNFQKNIEHVKLGFLEFLIRAKREGKKVCGFGAAAKGNTLLNYCGVSADLIDFVVDSSPHKQGKYLPGSWIPVLHPDEIKKAKPDYIIFFPWNLSEELRNLTSYVKEWGAKYVLPIPEVKVCDY